MKIKQVWIPYWDWEDFNNGMWRKLESKDEEIFLNKAIEFTGNHLLYGEAMMKVIIAWPKTMINSLTNTSINQKAFVGHCACAFEFNCPEYITRMAWKELTDTQRDLANNEAQNTINEWKRKYVVT